MGSHTTPTWYDSLEMPAGVHSEYKQRQHAKRDGPEPTPKWPKPRGDSIGEHAATVYHDFGETPAPLLEIITSPRALTDPLEPRAQSARDSYPHVNDSRTLSTSAHSSSVSFAEGHLDGKRDRTNVHFKDDLAETTTSEAIYELRAQKRRDEHSDSAGLPSRPRSYRWSAGPFSTESPHSEFSPGSSEAGYFGQTNDQENYPTFFPLAKWEGPLAMATMTTKKYAGLPDLDAAPEIYETPELTDDASTVQTNTLRTESPSPSDVGDSENVDRARLDRDEARRRFEPSVVDTRNANLSDAIGGNRQGYRSTHRRRRKRRTREDGVEEYGDLSADENSDEEETLGKKLARLRREAEEVRMELARRGNDAEEDEFRDAVDNQQKVADQDDEKDIMGGMEELSKMLERLNSITRQGNGQTLEEEFGRKLEAESTGRSKSQKSQTNDTTKDKRSTAISEPSSISAIAAFSDRLTALESTLGISQVSPVTSTTPVLPALESLSTQVQILSTILNPPLSTTATASSQANSSTLNLETLSSRLKLLQADADNLVTTRQTALQTLSQLHDFRSSRVTSSYAKIISRRIARQRDSLNTDLTEDSRPQSQHDASQLDKETPIADEEKHLLSTVFLEEQSSKITALYNILPTIQNLQPLLPTVLDRLRALNVVHAGAADSWRNMEELEARLGDMEGNIGKWRDAVEGVERGIEEMKEVMKENVDVVGGMVRDCESRFDRLEK